MAEAGSHSVHGVSQAMGAKGIGDLMESAHWPKTKLLGLLDVTSRLRPIESLSQAKDVAKTTEKLVEIQGVVDSFIDRHNLADKGVRLSVKGGPLNSILGNRYNPFTKEVHLPRVGKEHVLHELGHAADYTAGRVGRFRAFAEPILQRSALVALPIALVAGDRIKELLPGTIDDRAIEFMQNHAPEIMGATLAATSLYPEAKASFLAVSHIAKTEGNAAARSALKRLLPAFGTYVLGAIPAIVGMSLARKYMREAREEKAALGGEIEQQMRDLEKTGSIVRDLLLDAKSAVQDIGHVGGEIARSTAALFKGPNLGSKVVAAAKDVGTSPSFVYGALSTALPAAMGALYVYGTESGKEIRSRIHPEQLKKEMLGRKELPLAGHTSESWREQNPLRFAGLVAAGAALSGGIITRFFTDLQRVL